MIKRQVLLAVLTTAVAVAQDQPPSQPTFRTEANYVRVDVFPTRDGVPVADLTQSDFEILDNGVPQKVEQFERIVIRPAGPQDTRIEPNTVRESRAMLENSRSRVFVLFLDVFHVGLGGSYNIRKPLVEALDRVIGPDDLVGVMTPDMSPSNVAFARKTTTIDGMLARYWYWGERGRLVPPDPTDQRYQQCYGAIGEGASITKRMIERRHEKMTLDALSDLVVYLHGVREERKAVLTISEGWLLFRPDPTLANGVEPRPTPIGIDPRGGRLTAGIPKGLEAANSTADCDTDRLALSLIDNETQFRQIQDEANRANTSFYPIDPRGLPVFDTDIGPDAPPSLVVDAAMLRGRLTSLMTLANTTDGLAIVNSNDIARGLRRVVDDLTSYYLIGYYASGKLDGKFHAITVRVKRPGVSVRARRGYLAASEADANAAARATARASAAEPTPAAAAEARALESALAGLEGYARQLPVRLYAASGWKPGNTSAVWVAGEVGPEWRTGAQADLALMNAAGTTVATARATIEPGARSFRVTLVPDQPLGAGDLVIRARLRNADSTQSSNDSLRLTLPQSPDATGAMFVRRGPATANRDVPTADLRFRRSEQLRVELPTPSPAAVGARLLDRTGKALGVPVTAAVRDDADGSRWQVAQVALAPLAPADYLIEMSSEGKRTLLGFRVIP